MTRMTAAEALQIVAEARAAGRRANLWGADLRRANLRGADLRGADGAPPILQVSGLPSGPVDLRPTAEGWELRVGCWAGDGPEPLQVLISGDAGWPEADTDAERERRRPGLQAVVQLARAWVAMHPDAVTDEVARLAEFERIQAEVKAEVAR